MKTALFVTLVLVSLPYLAALAGAVKRARAAGATGEGAPRPTLLTLGLGFVTNFFDTLGIGSFAPTTAIFKFTGLVRDEWIPGTLNVGHTTPTLAEAFIFIAIVAVDEWTLVLMIAAAVRESSRAGRGATSRSAWAARCWPPPRCSCCRSSGSRPEAATRSRSAARSWRSGSRSTSCWAL
jgi:hypothetical protein